MPARDFVCAIPLLAAFLCATNLLSECLILTVPRGEVRTCAEAMNYRLWDEWLWTTAPPISELRVMACQQEFPRMPRPDDRLQA